MRDGLRNKSGKAQMESNALKAEKVGYERTGKSLSPFFLFDGRGKVSCCMVYPKEVVLLIDGLSGSLSLERSDTLQNSGVR